MAVILFAVLLPVPSFPLGGSYWENNTVIKWTLWKYQLYYIYVFFILCGIIYGIYDNYQMGQEIKDLIRVEFSKPLKIKRDL